MSHAGAVEGEDATRSFPSPTELPLLQPRRPPTDDCAGKCVWLWLVEVVASPSPPRLRLGLRRERVKSPCGHALAVGLELAAEVLLPHVPLVPQELAAPPA